MAFLGEIGTQISSEIKNDSNFQKAKKIGSKLAKRAIPAAIKAATYGLLDADAAIEKVVGDGIGDTVSDAVDDYLKQSNLIEEFRSSLGKAIVKLNEDGKKAQIIIFVDEIDRCRPVYAVELLERIKHLFNIENVIFVISLDKQQLHNSLGAVYGQGINSDEYLRRFIDLEYMLPKPDAKSFTNNLFNRFEFDKFFAQRTHSALRYESENLIESFAVLSDVLGLSLRAREQCFTRIRVAMMTISDKHYPHLLTILTLLKSAAPHIYRKYALEKGNSTEVIEYFKTKIGGVEMLRDRFGAIIEASLIAGDLSIEDISKKLQPYESLIYDTSGNHAEKSRLIQLINSVREFKNQGLSLPYVVEKLELAAQFK